MNDALVHLCADQKRKHQVRLQRITENPGCATVDDVTWLCNELKDAWSQLDYINNELPRLKAQAYSRAGGNVFR